MTIAGIRAMSALNWTTWTADILKAEIDRAKAIGLNGLSFLVWEAYITKYRTAATDPLRDVMAYAAQQGIRIILLANVHSPAYGDRELFWKNLTVQTQFINDLKWIVSRYPGAFGFQIEEPHRYGTDTTTAAACRTAYNAFLVTCKAVIPVGRVWGFNTASSWSVNMLNQGIDINYINTNKVFDHYAVQATTLSSGSLSAFISEINQVKGYFPNLEIMTVVYIQSSGTQNQAGCKDALGNVQWYNPACYNQLFFTELKWLKDNNIPFKIFRSEVLKFPRTIYPGDTAIAGAKVADMIKTVLGGTAPPPPAPTLYNIIASVSSSGLGKVRFMNDPTRESSTTYAMQLLPGTPFTIEAIPAQGYVFQKWNTSAGPVTTAKIQGVANMNMSFTADFIVGPPAPAPQNTGLDAVMVGFGFLVLQEVLKK